MDAIATATATATADANAFASCSSLLPAACCVVSQRLVLAIVDCSLILIMNQFFIIATDDCMRNKLVAAAAAPAAALPLCRCHLQYVLRSGSPTSYDGKADAVLSLWLTTRSLVQCDVPRQLCSMDEMLLLLLLHFCTPYFRAARKVYTASCTGRE